MTPRPPDEGDLVLERYRLQRLVGRGGAGTVWVADDERLNRQVAVKLLHPQPRVPQAAARLTREARTLAQLRHPGLVTLLDFGFTAENAPAMVMEYLEGVSLKELAETHPFSVPEVAAVLDQALAAIHACHEQGVIHRDLKPANVLVARSANALCVKIIDFGIVALAADAGATALTVSGEVFGSLRFMPPEQWRQSEIGPYTDLYALGCLAYHLLLGEPFIRELSPVRVYAAHMEQPRPRPTLDRNGGPVAPEFLDVLACACDPDWQNRYPDAPTMRAALRAFVGDVPTPPLPARAAKRSAERPVSVADLLNARTAVADVGAIEGFTSVMETAASAEELDPVLLGLDPLDLGQLDPNELAPGDRELGDTLLSAPPTAEDVGLPGDLQTRLMAAVTDRPVTTQSGSAVAGTAGTRGVNSSGPFPTRGGPVSAGEIPRASQSAPRPASLAPSVDTRRSPSVGQANSGDTGKHPSASAGVPWWLWLLVAALVGGIAGLVATRF